MCSFSICNLISSRIYYYGENLENFLSFHKNFESNRYKNGEVMNILESTCFSMEISFQPHIDYENP
jgi:hypothetical protein